MNVHAMSTPAKIDVSENTPHAIAWHAVRRAENLYTLAAVHSVDGDTPPALLQRLGINVHLAYVAAYALDGDRDSALTHLRALQADMDAEGQP